MYMFDLILKRKQNKGEEEKEEEPKEKKKTFWISKQTQRKLKY